MNIKNDTSTTVCLYSGFEMSLKSSSTFSWKFLSRLVISDIVGSCKTNLYGKRSAVSCTFLNEPMGKHPQPHLIWKKKRCHLEYLTRKQFRTSTMTAIYFSHFYCQKDNFSNWHYFLKGIESLPGKFPSFTVSNKLLPTSIAREQNILKRKLVH